MDPDKSDADPDQAQADEAGESMHKATEHIRHLWAKMNSYEQQKEPEISEPEDE